MRKLDERREIRHFGAGDGDVRFGCSLLPAVWFLGGDMAECALLFRPTFFS